MTHCKLFKMKEYMSAPHLTPCCISCILKPLHLYSPSAYDCWLCILLCRSTSLSPSITCVGMIYPVTTSPNSVTLTPTRHSSPLTSACQSSTLSLVFVECLSTHSEYILSDSALSPRVKSVSADGACHCFSLQTATDLWLVIRLLTFASEKDRLCAF